MPRFVLVIRLSADHGAVVPAQVKRRQIDLRPQLLRRREDVRADAGICGNAPGHGNFPIAGLFQRHYRPGHQRVGHRRGKGGAKAGNVQLFPHLFGMVDQVQSCSFQPGKAHIVGIFPGLAPGKDVFRLVPLPCGPVQRRAAGIGHPQHPRDLVEGFPRRVIQRRAEYVHVRVVFDLHDHRVAAGHHQTQKRRLQLRIGDVIGGDMSPDVVNRDQGFPQCQRRRLGEVHAHQHRADQTGGIGHGHGIDVAS